MFTPVYAAATRMPPILRARACLPLPYNTRYGAPLLAPPSMLRELLTIIAAMPVTPR